MNVVFDFGAVLFTWKPLDLVAEFFPAHASTPAQAGHFAHQVFGHADWHAFDRGSATMTETIERTVARLGLERAAFAQLVNSIGDRLVPIADTVALLRQLHAQRQKPGARSLQLYFLSNMPEPYARTLERTHDFLGIFDGGVFSGDVSLIKPEPAIYQLLQTRYALEPAKTVFTDDLLVNVKAAEAQGWHGVHFQSAAQLVQALQAFDL
jgi:putative hydrolase of the HAD superfamily